MQSAMGSFSGGILLETTSQVIKLSKCSEEISLLVYTVYVSGEHGLSKPNNLLV